MTVDRRGVIKSVIIHSDRGPQYCSSEYQALLASFQMNCSMTKAGECYVNAAIESWLNLKRFMEKNS
jgi:putative transposase